MKTNGLTKLLFKLGFARRDLVQKEFEEIQAEAISIAKEVNVLAMENQVKEFEIAKLEFEKQEMAEEIEMLRHMLTAEQTRYAEAQKRLLIEKHEREAAKRANAKSLNNIARIFGGDR